MSPGERVVADPQARLQYAIDLAWAALNRREHTVAELRGVLERKRVDPADIATVLAQLVAEGWLDDAGYARRFAEDRRNLDDWGPQRIERRLRALGIDGEHIAAAVGERSATEERAAAHDLLQRRFPEPPEDLRARNRALGFLMRKGFDSELAIEVVRRYVGAGEFD